MGELLNFPARQRLREPGDIDTRAKNCIAYARHEAYEVADEVMVYRGFPMHSGNRFPPPDALEV